MFIAIIDNHELFRDGLQALLERHNIKVITFDSGLNAIDNIANFAVDIVLLDMRMPELSGLETLIKIKQTKITNAPIVMLTTSTEESDLRECLKYGAQGYLLKDMNPTELVKSLHNVQKGDIIVAKDMMHLLAKILKNELSNEENIFQKLTPREQEVACLIASGLNNKLIAKNLAISDGTVKLHVGAILRKLTRNSRIEIAVMMIEGNYCK